MKLLSRGALVVLMAAIAAGAWFGIDYLRHDRETAAIDDSARRGAPGSFVRLGDGYTHCEWGGSHGARTVVLIHGFSVPYYLWDPTFAALIQAGFGALRYDLYGRGLSDRPDLTYNADLLDRQLSQLLEALHPPQPVDLVGASMGGPIAVTFAARHPQTVRTVSLFDPAYAEGGTLPAAIRWPLVGEYVMTVKIAPALAPSQRDDFLHPEPIPRLLRALPGADALQRIPARHPEHHPPLPDARHSRRLPAVGRFRQAGAAGMGAQGSGRAVRDQRGRTA